MSKADLTLFKEKYNTSDYFVSVVESLLNRLVEFEYISHSKASSLVELLYKNIEDVRLGSNNLYDFKSGYYDANKKELYIKDEKNIQAVYLRLLYALTTTEIDPNVYMVGYSTTKLRKDSYRLSYANFGINRAVMANLVYKLCNLLPNSLQIMPIKKTYTHDFLGFKIQADNDLYGLEGKLLAQTCFVLDLDPELLYSGLFTKNPIKYLDSIFDKKNFENKEKFLKLFDDISRKYNTYNKLAYLSNKLNDNYIEYKKHVLKADVDKIVKEQEIIESHINSVITNLYGVSEDEEIEVETGLSEALDKLETELKNMLIRFQDILCDNIIKSSSSLPYIKYANKLKCFNDILIIPNKKITKAIQDTILFKLMPNTEVTGINLVQKIKYAIIEQILSSTDFTNISNTFSFYNITNLENNDNGTAVILLNSDKKFAKIVEVKGLDKNINKASSFELNYIPLDNLKYVMNSNYSNAYIGNIEKLYTSLKNNFEELKNVPLDNISVFEYESQKYIVAYCNGNVYVISYVYSSRKYGFNMLNLSEQYKVFGKDSAPKATFKSNLPMLYKK
ncbi:MAG: hypothetical protein IJ272_09835 [Clostridia bacterium]|nr:hypothetical protein [Clostridia bacterium]